MTRRVPGWYPDPRDPTASHRWWDGARWTEALLPQPAPLSQRPRLLGSPRTQRRLEPPRPA
ncbi:DUF2510 domain-containing protein [Nocardia sp. NPDC060249]|uniref:DUF2510 domain-containing protein n=1 Tax=Nocardia sp. NPDC060249 TaxID=3347082 RepID=UPI003668F897